MITTQAIAQDIETAVNHLTDRELTSPTDYSD